MRDLSFFAKPPFLSTNVKIPYDFSGPAPQEGYLKRVSSLIRGIQIAEYLGAKLNPESGYQEDACVYVKPYVARGGNVIFEGKPYLDICDSIALCDVARKNPDVTAITASDYNFEFLKTQLPNRIINIPEQHCNFERIVYTPKEIRRIGVIGNAKAFVFIPEEIREGLKERGLELVEFSRFFSRQDVIDFYGRIDLQLVWRPYHHKLPLANPLKLVNAASFGIPTIALHEDTFDEMEDCYVPVETVDEFFEKLDILRKNMDIFEGFSQRCLWKSEMYHIENIAELYRSLGNE